ncbi:MULTISPECIES: hypothetical protein [Chryseobacterium]|uniref:Uncharacterized protein n=1 Tax=Chryseobacterium gambrini TaxID=373672 RepID=A0A1N7LDY0_9FLAO|nr:MULTISPECIES: hypothetical protein [Chryseobacterium]SIS72029.1 hypothetical protein SAMN05421785_102170 [Chryseobacterium gambrini]
MLSFQGQSYKTPCGPISGGISELFWFDPEDYGFTQAAPTAALILPPYTAIELRDGAVVADGAKLFPIDLEDETGKFTAKQTLNGRSEKWDYEITGELGKMGNSLTNFFARLSAASICSNIGLVIVDNTGSIHVLAEKWVNDKVIPKFKMKNDGSEIHLEEKFDGKNGGTLSLKGVYSRGPLEYTGGRDSLEAFIDKP